MRLEETRQKLSDAEKNGNLLSTISEIYRQERRSDDDSISIALSELHNDSSLNINEILTNHSRDDSKRDFFVLLDVYESVLPLINSDPQEVVECLIHLLGQAGSNLAIGGLFSGFSEYCKLDFQRCTNALQFILSEPETFAPLSANAIIAAQLHNEAWAVEQLKDLVIHARPEIRRQGFSAIGRINFSTPALQEQLFKLLEQSAEREQDSLGKSEILRASVLVGKKTQHLWDRVVSLADALFSEVSPEVLYEASRIAAFEYADVPDELLDTLVVGLEKCTPEYKGILDNIDHFLVKLVETSNHKSLEMLLEKLLCSPEAVDISSFDYFSNELIGKYEEYFNVLATKWLISGQRDLYEALSTLLHKTTGKEIELSVDYKQFDGSEELISFAARKAVGWLFTVPVPASSFILSLYSQCPASVKVELEELLLDPLLMSFPGELKKFFSTKSKDSDFEAVCSRLLSSLEEYQDGKKGAYEIRELMAPQENARFYWKQFSRGMQKARDNGPKPLFEQLCTVQNLLYGNSSIVYTYDGSGQSHRSEMQMHSISHTAELPMMNVLDPEGLDYKLRFFRVERLTDEVSS